MKTMTTKEWEQELQEQRNGARIVAIGVIAMLILSASVLLVILSQTRDSENEREVCDEVEQVVLIA